ncbi:hypothetical protein [Fuscovulum ytuae]|uniref:Uncharacterized protein n=1 Tax=Fuscovulum ytuae TaxID=3042299 RepID=A0ABY8Q2A3_9RHOB|nr:hypothetical protein [Fuscovulum sp. YMD61]WGV14923.1 hypothetical protein QF092_11565 [Fuscovulum sp. YMD61]
MPVTTLRDLIVPHRIDGLPSKRALEHPFFNLAVDEVRTMPKPALINELRLLPKVGSKSFRIILDVLGTA